MFLIKIFIPFLFILFSFQLKANNENDSLKSRFRPGFMWYYDGIKKEKDGQPRKYGRVIFDLTYSTFNGEIKSFSNNPLSIGLNTNVLFDIPLNQKGTFGLGLGFCHALTNVRHDNSLFYDKTTQTSVYQTKDELDAYKKSTLSGNSFSIPVELRFKTKNWNHFKFHLGGKFGYQANLFNKFVVKNDSDYSKIKNYFSRDINSWIYSIYSRIGFRTWSLYGSYSFNTIFKNPNSTKVNLIQLGISLSLF